MRSSISGRAVGVCLFIILILTVACRRDPTAIRDEALKRGDALVVQKKIPEAIVEFRRAVIADPRSREAREKLGRSYLEQGNGAGALAEYVRASDLAPDDLKLQLEVASLYLFAGQFEEARVRAEKVMARDPKNVTAMIIRGDALGGLKRFDDAIRQIETVIQAAPTAGIGYASLGSLQVARGDPARAEEAFKKAIAVHPESVELRLSLAGLYWSTKRGEDAERLLRETLSLDPRNLLASRALASFYLSTGRLAEAEAPLKVIAENTQGPEGQLALADYYASIGKPAEARRLYEPMSRENNRSGAVAKIRLGWLLSTGGDHAAGTKLVDEVLAKEPHNVEALVTKAQLLLSDARPADALKTAREAVNVDPQSSMAQFTLGRMLAVSGLTDEAIAVQKDALKANPRFVQAAVELARLSLLQDNPKAAAEYAEAALVVLPSHPEAQLFMARSQIALGNFEAAETTLKTLSASYGNAPTTQAEIGRLLYSRGNAAGARAAFGKALAADPLQLSAIEGMTVLDLNEKKTAAARARIDGAVAAAPKNAPMEVLAARMYIFMQDLGAAERVLTQAMTVDPGYLPSYELLGRIYAQEKRLPQAVAQFEKILERTPRAVGPNTAVAILLMFEGKTDEAIARYEKVIAIDPYAAVASNNLAQIYADRNEKLDVALQLAQVAKSALPTDPDVDDTLGWVYYKKHVPAQAVLAFKRSVAANSANEPIYLYHLGLAYVEMGNHALGKQSLEKALQLKPDFDGADDARKVLQSLRG